ncbi:ribulokinase [Tissierella sp. Yu-01]|uniref:ribulokinase n=1 Tax=Tissierella sp. Yu-01 TaxID=3035694 RepID=UPI00240E2300|nr:ribulokinase [Tissierella sp. Yu-01]WFA10133.1 ribulokinase [Tissierella sp. Yu-01]
MKYSIGLDFGTQSGRAVLVEVETGNIIAQATKEYTHGVMVEYLPDGKTRLPHDFALQHPKDYLDVLEETIPAVIKESGVSNEDIIGLSTDFTACTILPIDNDGTPLCFREELKKEPHAYVKLWKHHAAEEESQFVTDTAKERNEEFLKKYGGKISSEWLVPKVLQILNEAPVIYDMTYSFMEAADWINLVLTGSIKRSSCHAGYKGTWNKSQGYPSKDFFKALDPKMENFVEEKLTGDVYSLGGKAGEINEEWAKRTGLKEGTAVGISIIDAHSGVPGIGICEPGKLLMIMGTSTCHILLGETEEIIPGIAGVVEDGVLPGFFGYEAGQACVGDHFSWLVDNFVPEVYVKEAKERNIGIHQLLTEKAEKLNVGESGLLALDWWNGNRTPYVDYDLTGLMLGFSLTTKPEEMYRALIEATAYGTNYIIETFENAGVPIKELYACGGIAEKNKMMMQIYADVTNREIRISASDQTPALGAAMFGAVAAGKKNGGYDTIFEAAKVMGKVKDEYYKPIPENVKVYKKLYNEYKILSEYFAKDNNVMKRLKSIKKSH